MVAGDKIGRPPVAGQGVELGKDITLGKTAAVESPVSIGEESSECVFIGVVPQEKDHAVGAEAELPLQTAHICPVIGDFSCVSYQKDFERGLPGLGHTH